MLPFFQYAITFMPFWGTILASLDSPNDWQHGRDWWNAPIMNNILYAPINRVTNFVPTTTVIREECNNILEEWGHGLEGREMLP